MLWSPYCLILFPDDQFQPFVSSFSRLVYPDPKVYQTSFIFPSLFTAPATPSYPLFSIFNPNFSFFFPSPFLSYRNHSSSTAFRPLPSFLFLHTYCVASPPSLSSSLSLPVYLILSRLYSPPGPSPWLPSAKLTRTWVLGSLFHATFIGYG